MVGCTCACGRKPHSANPLGKLISKHTKEPPPGGLFVARQSSSRWSGASRCFPSASTFEPRITLQSVRLPVPTRRTMTRILPWADDCDEAPILDLLRLAETARFRLADRLPDAPILLHGAGLADHVERKREERNRGSETTASSA